MHIIPVKIVKEFPLFFTDVLYNNINNSIYSGTFPNKLKIADVTPIYKTNGRNDKENYRPISILPSISKIYEKILCRQLHAYFETFLSYLQCGFRKGFSSQHCMLTMIERLKASLDKKGCTGILLTDLSKAFDCVCHELLIAKLNAYGLSYNALLLINSYFENRYQRVRVNSSYSKWSRIKSGVPQGSILGPFGFNVDLIDLFFELSEDLASYADDNTPYACDEDIGSVITKLENEAHILLIWLKNNYFKANPDKFHLLLNVTDPNLSVHIDGFNVQNTQEAKLLGVTINGDLSFENHVSKLCKNASQKVHAFARISNYMDTGRKRQIMKAFIESSFGYCPLVWMFHSRSLNTRINRIHERALRIVYNDELSTFKELLEKDNSFTIHERNIQTMAMEIYKVVHGLSPEIMKSVFPIRIHNRYNSNQIFQTRNVRTVHYGINSLAHLGPKIWSIIPEQIKSESCFETFKRKIKRWRPSACPCKLCKIYLQRIGYIETTQ